MPLDKVRIDRRAEKFFDNGEALLTMVRRLNLLDPAEGFKPLLLCRVYLSMPGFKQHLRETLPRLPVDESEGQPLVEGESVWKNKGVAVDLRGGGEPS